MSAVVIIGYKPSFVRQYRRFSPELQQDIQAAITRFQSDPRDPSLRVHKLGGKLRGFLSFSVNYRYRIVFLYEKKDTAVLLAVGDHDVYR